MAKKSMVLKQAKPKFSAELTTAAISQPSARLPA